MNASLYEMPSNISMACFLELTLQSTLQRWKSEFNDEKLNESDGIQTHQRFALSQNASSAYR